MPPLVLVSQPSCLQSRKELRLSVQARVFASAKHIEGRADDHTAASVIYENARSLYGVLRSTKRWLYQLGKYGIPRLCIKRRESEFLS